MISAHLLEEVNPLLLKKMPSYSRPDRCKHKEACEDISTQANYCVNQINNLGYRSENFTDQHEESHVLFAGCSYTWGVALKKSEMWAGIVYEKISKDKKRSGFFNLGWPGTSIHNQVFDILKYCSLYGNPELIFYCMPSTSRPYNVGMFDDDIYFNSFPEAMDRDLLSITSKAFIDFTEMINYMSYFTLHQYCKSNNIELYSFTWNEVLEGSKKDRDSLAWPSRKNGNSSFNHYDNSISTSDINPFSGFQKIKNFDSFYYWNREELMDFCIKFIKDYSGSEKEFLQVARDDIHLGIAPNAFWADFIYNKYKERHANA